MVSRPVTVNDILDGHVGLDLECLDRIYLNGYVPNLQVGGQVVSFLTAHLGFPIPSPAIFDKIGGRFRRAVAKFAAGQRDPGGPLRQGRPQDRGDGPVPGGGGRGRGVGVAAIGVAQEFAKVFTGTAREGRGGGEGGAPWFCFAKADRRVTCYYFYLWDEDFGPAFVKVCCYFPYPMKIWINGHEWAKRQAAKAGIGFTALSNGFATCEDPAGLQAICDRLGPGDDPGVRRAVVGAAAAAADRRRTGPRATGGTSRCVRSRSPAPSCSTRPGRARAFFEALVGDNLDIGRPDSVEILFGRKVTARDAGNVHHPGDHPRGRRHRERLLQALPDQAVPEGRAGAAGRDRGQRHRRPRRQAPPGTPARAAGQRARAVNRRLVDTERVGQGCVLASPAFERVARPTLADGRRAPALRFGDPRVMALVGALAIGVNVVAGFTNRSLRAQVSPLLGVDYTMGQASYDLRRLRLKGLIVRLDALQHLRPDPRRATGRDLLHQGPRPAATARCSPPTDHPPRYPSDRHYAPSTTHVQDYINNARMAA